MKYICELRICSQEFNHKDIASLMNLIMVRVLSVSQKAYALGFGVQLVVMFLGSGNLRRWALARGGRLLGHMRSSGYDVCHPDHCD